MFNVLLAGTTKSAMSSIIMLAVFVVTIYFFMIRPQKKQAKEAQSMRDSLKSGDNIVTIGGIYGKIVKTKEETIVIAVGADKVKFEIAKWAVSSVLKPADLKNNKTVDTYDEKAKKEAEKREKIENGEETTNSIPILKKADSDKADSDKVE